MKCDYLSHHHDSLQPNLTQVRSFTLVCLLVILCKLTMFPGLFHKSIIMSGSAMCDWAFTKNHIQRAFDLGKLLGCDTKDKEELLNFFRTITPKTFAGTQDKIMNQKVSLGLLRRNVRR